MAPEAKLVIPAETTALEVLRAIDTWAGITDVYDARRLWAILTALRGPDTADDAVKAATTQHIRGIVPTLAGKAGAFRSRFDTPAEFAAALDVAQQEAATLRETPSSKVPHMFPWWHFAQHIDAAVNSLRNLLIESNELPK